MRARHAVAAALAVVLGLQVPCSAARRRPADPLKGRRIGSIRIERFNVFNTDVYPESKLGYRMANALHRTTREGVVRRELLFEVGQPYDASLVRETERNLRLLPIIRSASAVAVLNSSGTVDIVVRTYDAWSLEVTADFKRAGGVTQWKAGATERNLLGRGSALSAEYDRAGVSPSRSVSWRDIQFLGRHHLDFAVSAESGADRRRYDLAIERPFYASIASASAGVKGDYDESKSTLYRGEIPAGRALRRASELGVGYGVALATSTARTRRVRAGIMNRHVDFLPLPDTPPGALPRREQFVFLQLGGDWEELDFVTMRRLQRFTRDEDYNLGLGLFPTLAWAPRSTALNSSESQVLPGALVSKGFAWSGQLLLLKASYSTAFANGANANRIAGGDALWFLTGLPRQTLAAHAAYDHGWRLDPGSRLTLGESNGLRGYGLNAFSGERRLVLNLEDRVFLYDEVLRLVDVGAVVFFDSGFVWGAGAPARVSDLRHGAGVGLRLASSRSAGNNPVRIDAARALNPNGTGSRWTLSVIAGHAFGP